MYESPIEIITTGVDLLVEENVYKTVTKLGINVDKDEILRALQYDREQYQKGYDDGCKGAIKEINTKIKEKLHEAEMHGNFEPVVTAEMFDSVIKEMVGEQE